VDAGSTQANKLSRTSAGLIEALNRHRGKGQQKVTVASTSILGAGGRGCRCRTSRFREVGGIECQTNPPCTSARVAERGPAAQAMPIRSDAEWPVQDAWRAVPTGSEGE
jgi:hypothetical protein